MGSDFGGDQYFPMIFLLKERGRSFLNFKKKDFLPYILKTTQVKCFGQKNDKMF